MNGSPSSSAWRRIGGEDAVLELVGLVPGGDRVAHGLELTRVVRRDAVSDLVRRDEEVAVEVDRPGARPAAETADEDDERQQHRQQAERDERAHAPPRARQFGRAHRSPLQRRAHTTVIDPGERRL